MSCSQGTIIREYYIGVGHCQSYIHCLQLAVYITFSAHSALLVILLLNWVLLKNL
jgi:hypothetical protein